MSDRQPVGIAEIRLARDPDVLVAYGLGSCLGVVLYHPHRRIGGMAHCLLPSPMAGLEGRPGKFVTAAIHFLAETLVPAQEERHCLMAKIVGGANMFGSLQVSPLESVGDRNIQAARETLDMLGIPLVGEDVGGGVGRTVIFELTTGVVRVRTVRKEEEIRSI